MKDCSVEISVYNITLTPHILKLNQPVEVIIEHCVNLEPGQENAKGKAPTDFEYLKGGTFFVDLKTGRKTGRILVSSFSWLAIVWEYVSGLFTGPEYLLRVLYDDSETMCRKVQFILTKNLPQFDKVRLLSHIPYVSILSQNFVQLGKSAINPF